MMNDITLLVLAAGLGSRYKGQKQTDTIGNQEERLMEFALYDAQKLGIKKFVFIVNNRFPKNYKNYLKTVLGSRGCILHFVEQTLQKSIPENYKNKIEGRTKPLGTAHAVLCAQPYVTGPFITVNADDFYGFHAFEAAVNNVCQHKINADTYAMVAFRLQNTLSHNGSVSRGVCTVNRNNLKEVEEFKEIEKTGQGIYGINELGEKKELAEDTWVSMNFWVLPPSFFKLVETRLQQFLQTANMVIAEFYLPDVINYALAENRAMVQVIPTSEQWFGLTYQGDKEAVITAISQQKKAGKYPQKLWS